MPVVALLTDFGLRDHYVGAMKGVVLSVCPDATLVDITHEIPPQDVVTAALELAAVYRYMPPATVFLIVVDPGVGSARRPIAAEASGYYFVGPDNGVLSEVFRESPPGIVVELSERRYARPAISRTFEGRDRFAPAAGWLARGVELSAFGAVVSDPCRLELPTPKREGNVLCGEVILVDRFGNLITNIERRMIDRLGPGAEAIVGAHERVPVVATYAAAPPGTPCALIGSSDRLEIAVNRGSAAQVLGGTRGTRVTVAV